MALAPASHSNHTEKNPAAISLHYGVGMEEVERDWQGQGQGGELRAAGKEGGAGRWSRVHVCIQQARPASSGQVAVMYRSPLAAPASQFVAPRPLNNKWRLTF